jgi:sugar transferase (PEP-CTERM system associated)
VLARGRQSGLLLLWDTVSVIVAVPLAATLRLGTHSELVREPGFLLAAGVVNAAVFLAAFHYSDLYELRTLAQEKVLLARVLRALAVGTALLAILYYAIPELMLGRGILALTACLVGLWAYGSRELLKWVSRSGLHERILILGAGDPAVEVGREILLRRRLGYDLVGFLDQTRERVGVSILNPGIVGAYADLVDVCRSRRIDRVLVCVKDRRGAIPFEQLLAARTRGIDVEDGASFSERLTGRIPIRDITPSWFIFGPGFRQPRAALAAKRSIDVITSIAGLVVCAPVFALTALAIRLESPGPVFFTQERVGRHGKSFRLVKFRSMRQDAEAKSGPVWAQKHDDRITRIGRFIRKTRIDELPQFVNVLRGDMSLVGPRPERPFFVDQLSKKIPFYDMRHVVRPGCTGWAQVRWRYGASEEDAMQKLQYDLYYIKHLSLRRDLLVMFDTLKVMVLGEGR